MQWAADMVALAEQRRAGTSSAYLAGEEPDETTLRATAAGVVGSLAPQIVARADLQGRPD